MTALALWSAVEPYTEQCPESLREAYREKLLPRQVEWLRELARQDQRLRDTVFLDLLESLEAGGVHRAEAEQEQLQERFLAGVEVRLDAMAARDEGQMVDALEEVAAWQRPASGPELPGGAGR